VERAHLLIKQAEAVAEPPEDPMLLFFVLERFWIASLSAFNGDAMHELATQFLALAEMQGAALPLMIGHRLMGTSLVWIGEIVEGRTHLDEAVALHNPAGHRAMATRFAYDASLEVMNLCIRSNTLWVLGYPKAALADGQQALSDAREIGRPEILMEGLAWTSVLNILCGNHLTEKVLVDELIALADEKGGLFYKAFGMLMQGWLFALTGKASDAVRALTSGLAARRSTGATVGTPLFISYLASAYAELSQFDDAWRCIGEALAAIETTKEKLREAEVNRIAGEIALRSPERDAAKAEAYFKGALAIAGVQQAKSCELRAAMSMARLWRDQGKREEARELLAPVYSWFTEGFDTLDLKEAKALLEQFVS
jgi:predicted ATPase